MDTRLRSFNEAGAVKPRKLTEEQINEVLQRMLQ